MGGQNKEHGDVMVVLDTSGSRSSDNRMEQAKAALKTFIQQLGDEDGIGATIFSSQATRCRPDRRSEGRQFVGRSMATALLIALEVGDELHPTARCSAEPRRSPCCTWPAER